MSTIRYQHKMAAHCETGTIAGLLNHAGLSISEPMVLGITGGIFFAYLKIPAIPFPTFVVRSQPGRIIRNMTRRVKVGFHTTRYRDAAKAQAELDALVAQGMPVAVQVDMFNMGYIPAYMRVHFNGHFVTVIGKEGDSYTISDCYHAEVATVPAADLARARFARGDMAPHGTLFYVKDVPPSVDFRKPIVAGLRDAVFNMVKIPVPFLGVKGIRLFARKLMDWPDLARDEVQLSHEIMNINIILEERGTGGGGFRFMFGSFLREAAGVLKRPELEELSREMMTIGDHWRDLSLRAARTGKSRDFSTERFRELQNLILARADEEEAFFRKLDKLNRSLR
jgi:hypothetical protein